MTQTRIVSLIIVLFLWATWSSVYVVSEGQQALLGQTKIIPPGIHFKWPFINQASVFDMRLQKLDIQLPSISLADKRVIHVNYFVQWRVRSLPVYAASTGGHAAQVRMLLEQKLNAYLEAQLAHYSLVQLVMNEGALMEALRQEANLSANGVGIEVVDVRIKHIDLPTEMSTTLYEEMRSRYQQEAVRLRERGKTEAEFVRTLIDQQASIIVAEAKIAAATLRGKADAEAAKIYADAYGKDLQFYAFYRSLLAYKNVFAKKQDIFVIKPDGQFFKYFKNTSLSSLK